MKNSNAEKPQPNDAEFYLELNTIAFIKAGGERGMMKLVSNGGQQPR